LSSEMLCQAFEVFKMYGTKIMFFKLGLFVGTHIVKGDTLVPHYTSKITLLRSTEILSRFHHFYQNLRIFSSI